MSHLTIVAHIRAKEGKQALVHEELVKLIAPTRAEAGCVNYDLHRDNDDDCHFLFFENWETRDHWLAHMETEHIKAYLEAAEGAVEEFNVSEMTFVG